MVKKVKDWDGKDFDSMYSLRSARQKRPSIKSMKASMDSQMHVLTNVLTLLSRFAPLSFYGGVLHEYGVES